MKKTFESTRLFLYMRVELNLTEDNWIINIILCSLFLNILCVGTKYILVLK